MGRTVRAAHPGLPDSSSVRRDERSRHRQACRARRHRMRAALASRDAEEAILGTDWRAEKRHRFPHAAAAPRNLDIRTFGTFINAGSNGLFHVARCKQILRRGQPGAFTGHRFHASAGDWTCEDALRNESASGSETSDRDGLNRNAKLLSLCDVLADIRNFPYKDCRARRPAHAAEEQTHLELNKALETEEILRSLADNDVADLVRESLSDLGTHRFGLYDQLSSLIRHQILGKPKAGTGSSAKGKPAPPEEVAENLKAKKRAPHVRIETRRKRRAVRHTGVAQKLKLGKRAFKPRHTWQTPSCVGRAAWLPERPLHPGVAKPGHATGSSLPSVSVVQPSGQVVLDAVRFDPFERITDLRRRIEAHVTAQLVSPALRAYGMDLNLNLVSPAGAILPREEDCQASVGAFGLQAGDVLTAVKTGIHAPRLHEIAVCNEIRIVQGSDARRSMREDLVRLDGGCAVLRTSRGDRLRVWSDGSCQMLTWCAWSGQLRPHAMQLLDGTFEISGYHDWIGGSNGTLAFSWSRCLVCDVLPVAPLRLSRLECSSQWTEKDTSLREGRACEPWVPWSIQLDTTPLSHLTSYQDADLDCERDEIEKTMLLFGFRHAAHGGF